MKENSEKMVSMRPDEQQPTTPDEKPQFSLYVQGAAWLKDRENAVHRLKEFEPRIHAVRHPRQKSADYCFVDFESASDRDQSFENLKTHSEIKVKQSTKDVPKRLEKRQQKVADKRAAKLATKQLIKQIKKKEKLSTVEKSNQIVLPNVPEQATQIELKMQYPNAIKINLKKIGKRRSAIVTFANYHHAFAASKEESFSLHGRKINAVLNTSTHFRPNSKKKAKKGIITSKDEHEKPPAIPKMQK